MDSTDGMCASRQIDNSLTTSFDDAEPSTQPLTQEEDSMELEDSQDLLDTCDKVHGYLIPLKPKDKLVSIDKEVFTVGRSVRNSYVAKNANAEKNAFISKIHFEIHHGQVGGPVYLIDKSSNGTFVNKRKIGNGKKVLLAHNSVISMSIPNIQDFVYLSTNKDYQKPFCAALRKKYVVSRELGQGACGTVFLGIKKEDQSQVAIKAINRAKVSMIPGGAGGAGIETSRNNVFNEVKLLQKIDHPCIIRLEDVIDAGGSDLYIVLELAHGGELFEKIIEKTRLSEKEAKLYFYQIVSAIEYLHRNNICHRDLKPENILLCSDDDVNPVIKVTDLGLSKFVDMHTHLKTFCGTPQYLAPEVLLSRVKTNGIYDMKVDMWSLGVILYILLCGCPPFNKDREDKPLVRQVTEGDYHFPSKFWSKISPNAIDLVKKLMTVRPQSRLSAKETLHHPWLKDKEMVDQAEKLMKSQQKSVTSVLPKEPEEEEEEEKTSEKAVEERAPILEEPSKDDKNEKFKRPLDEKVVPFCKRVKVGGVEG